MCFIDKNASFSGTGAIRALDSGELGLVGGGLDGVIDLDYQLPSGSSPPSLGSTPSLTTVDVYSSGNVTFGVGVVGSPLDPQGPALSITITF
jgi:hypothetical protein